MEKWHQEWKCAPEALNESGDEEGDKSSDGEDNYLEAAEEIMENALEQIQDAAIEMMAEQDPEIEMEDKSTNTECVFVQTKCHYGKSAPPSKGNIVIKRSQTFSPSAVVNKNDYVCRVSSELSGSYLDTCTKIYFSS